MLLFCFPCSVYLLCVCVRENQASFFFLSCLRVSCRHAAERMVSYLLLFLSPGGSLREPRPCCKCMKVWNRQGMSGHHLLGARGVGTGGPWPKPRESGAAGPDSTHFLLLQPGVRAPLPTGASLWCLAGRSCSRCLRGRWQVGRVGPEEQGRPCWAPSGDGLLPAWPSVGLRRLSCWRP